MLRLAFLLGLTLLSSCSVTARLQVLDDGRAAVSARLVAQPALLAYWKDLAELDAKLPPSPLDVKTFRQALAAQAGAKPPKLTAPKVEGTASTVDLSFGVPDTASMLGSRELGRTTKTGERTELVLTLDRTTLRKLAALTTWGSSPALGVLLPAEAAQVSAQDYAQLLEYLLEPYDNAAQALIDASTVELRLELPRAPVTVEGAASVSGATVVARWPLARVLSLETPVVLRAVY